MADQQRIAEIRARQSEFAAGVPEAVEWFVSLVLDTSRYPRGFPCTYQVAYRPENRDVVVEFELPPKQVVPEVRGYRYIKTRDEIEALPRPQNEIRQCYKRLIACVALRTLYEIFTATPSEVVEDPGAVPGVLPLPALALPAIYSHRDHLRQLQPAPEHAHRPPGRDSQPGCRRRLVVRARAGLRPRAPRS